MAGRTNWEFFFVISLIYKARTELHMKVLYGYRLYIRKVFFFLIKYLPNVSTILF